MLLMLIAGIHSVISFLQFVQKLIHFICRSLSIIVQAHYIIAVGMPQARHQCRMLPEISGEADSFDIIVFLTQFPDRPHGIVR